MGKPPGDAKSVTIQHFSHAHPLNLTSIEVAALVPPSCSCCKKRVDSWAYTCQYCKFFLHTECSNLPQLVNHQFHTIHNLILLANDKDPYECDACGERGEGFSYHCRPCSLNLHTVCSVMPTHLFSHSHQHQLSLTYRSPYPTQTFSCDVCRSIGSKWVYRCSVCEFDAHLKCAKEAPATQPRPYGEIPALHVNPMMNSQTNVATVQVPMMANDMWGNGRQEAAPVRHNFSGAYGRVTPNMAPLNRGYTMSYSPHSRVRPMAMHQGAYNGALAYQAANGQPIMQSTAFPAQYAVPQGFNGNQGVNQQRNGNSFTNQLLQAAVSGAAEGLVGSMVSGGSSNGGVDTVLFMDGNGGADTGMLMDEGAA